MLFRLYIDFILGAYLNILGQIESLAHSFKTQLQEHDIEVPVDKKWPRQPCLETLKFLFKQLQKEVEDSSMNTFGIAFRHSFVVLYIMI